MSITIDDQGNDVTRTGARKVDVHRGTLRGEVSTQWRSRPDDQKFLSVTDLMSFLDGRTAGTREDVIHGTDMVLLAQRDAPDSLLMQAPDGGEAVFTNHAFQQACALADAPYSYLREKPAFITAVNLMDDFRSRRDLGQKLYWNEMSREVRAFTGENYGRILDVALAQSVHRIAGNGTGDTFWKVPGAMNWGNMTYNPYVDVTKESTTLFASDRDVFMFLVDDTRPIEVGKLPNGDPDLIFRGFYAWNSEVGTRSLGIATFWLRAVCQNRNLWGTEDFEEITIRHSRFAPDRFARDAAPALLRYTEASPTKLVAGIRAAQDARVAKDDDERRAFLSDRKWDLPKATIDDILATIEREEQHPAESVWDMVNGITAVARQKPTTDARLKLEKIGAKMMDHATRGRI